MVKTIIHLMIWIASFEIHLISKSPRDHDSSFASRDQTFRKDLHSNSTALLPGQQKRKFVFLVATHYKSLGLGLVTLAMECRFCYHSDLREEGVLVD